ncbi:MAG: nucleotidyltransferase [Blastocatellales bacterium]
MPIPETQLKIWSNQGATEGSAKTYASIKAALDTYSWPEGMRPVVYLQGSYPNSTNTRGNSDVDVVAEMDCVYYSNLTELDKPKVGWTPGRYEFADFRPHVIKALKSYYGERLIDDSGGKAIKVLASSGRLNADIVPCVQYKRYDENLQVIGEGITFWNQRTGEQIINYPKLHIRNGEQKNSAERTKGGYKPSLRMFKNARSVIAEGSEELKKKYPSYFVECLFSNVPDSVYLSSYQYTFESGVAYLSEALKNGNAATFVTQSGHHWLFGNQSVQWSQDHARDLIARMQNLWKNWYQ